jgi:hypothetical protein
MVDMPLWAVIAIGFGSPILAFLGVLVAQYVCLKGNTELEMRSRREETMRNLRWAAELAVSSDPARSALGVAQLVALGESDLLDTGQQLFVDAALAAVIEDAAEEVEAAGPDVEVVRLPEAVARGEVVGGDVESQGSTGTEGETDG